MVKKPATADVKVVKKPAADVKPVKVGSRGRSTEDRNQKETLRVVTLNSPRKTNET